ncbi:MAG: SemiSWEET family transporter [Burkholderiales bacterium]
MVPPDCAAISQPQDSPPVSGLEKLLRALSVATMLMTVPQVVTIWVGQDAGGVSLLSWAAYLVSACLWFVYGLQKRDKTIYLACIGWVVLDAAIVAGVIVHR